MSLTAIVPVKDRPEVAASARSLLAASPDLRELLLCDGGSQQPPCRQALSDLAQLPGVRLLSKPQAGFNKSQLLNRGLLAAQSEWVLLADADILWTRAALQALWAAARAPRTLATIATVRETRPGDRASQRPRYTYAIGREPSRFTVAIVPDRRDRDDRPGCGLLCARRADLLALGGFKTELTGWGWEDRDLLLRAELCGYRWVTAGAVQHQSHPEAWRNRFGGGLPAVTRDRNLSLSLQGLAAGQFWGDLPPLLPRAPAPARPVQVLPQPAL